MMNERPELFSGFLRFMGGILSVSICCRPSLAHPYFPTSTDMCSNYLETGNQRERTPTERGFISTLIPGIYPLALRTVQMHEAPFYAGHLSLVSLMTLLGSHQRHAALFLLYACMTGWFYLAGPSTYDLYGYMKPLRHLSHIISLSSLLLLAAIIDLPFEKIS